MSRAERCWPLLALAAAAIWPVRGAVFAGQVLYDRDIHLAWHPAVEGFVRAIVQRAWPLWDPAPAFGQPMLADPNSMAAYPPTWLNLVMPPWAYYTLFTVAHLWWSALGTYLLSRRWGCTRAAATAAGAVWCLSGPGLSLVSLYHHFASATWMPWVFLTAERALLTRRRRDVACWALAMAAQVLGGSPDMTAITWLALAAYAALRLGWWRRPLARRNLALLATAGAAVALALAVSAVQWLPAAELVTRSARLDLPASTRTYWSLHPLGLAEAWMPDLWGFQGLRPELHSALSESRGPFLRSIYLGIATLPLVAAAFLGRRPRRRALAALAVASLLVALGRHFVAYSVATTLLPPLSLLRYPVKVLVLFAWIWALLCGQGLEALGRARSRRRWTAGALAAAVAAAAALVAGAWMIVQPSAVAARLLERPDEAAVARKGWTLLAVAAIGVAAGALAVLRGRPRARASLLAGAAAALAVLDLAAFNADVNPTAPRGLYARPPLVDLLATLGAQRIHPYAYTFEGSERDLASARVPTVVRWPDGWNRRSGAALAQQMYLMPATAGRWGLESGFEGDPRGLFPRAVADLVSALPYVEGTAPHLRLLQVGGITHVLSLHDIPMLRLLATEPGLLRSPLRVYEVPAAMPRAYAVGAARPPAGGHAVRSLLDPSFDPEGEVVLDAAADGTGTPGRAGRVAVTARKADRVSLTAEMDREGYVVLLETYDPGWRVRVDGRPEPLLAANAAFRAVRVPRGRHVVDMVYRPPAAAVGAALTLVGAGVAAAALGRVRRVRPA